MPVNSSGDGPEIEDDIEFTERNEKELVVEHDEYDPDLIDGKETDEKENDKS